VALLIDDDAEAQEEAQEEVRKEAGGAEHLGLTRRRRRELAVAGPYVVTEGLLGGRS
jgi:GH24 family phage-related lysozyme (muramidase)